MRKSLVELEKYGNMSTRHHGKANVVFCDGHVESPTLKFLFEDTSDAALVRWNRDHQPHREK
ncbi:H-X9-DG-CTERM domain-containing protein [Pedosphaera parvula]|nr:H-X9-DG-CTERM domain-containing protein [Pedosphaera parvula]